MHPIILYYLNLGRRVSIFCYYIRGSAVIMWFYANNDCDNVTFLCHVQFLVVKCYSLLYTNDDDMFYFHNVGFISTNTVIM